MIRPAAAEELERSIRRSGTVYRGAWIIYNNVMDAWLAPEAVFHLKALGLAAGERGIKGYLIGHRRGGRLIVERVLPIGFSLVGILSRLHEIETNFNGRLLGFFLYNPSDNDKKRLLTPSLTGRLVLELRTGARIRKPVRAFIVEFTGHFRLYPLPLAGDISGV